MQPKNQRASAHASHTCQACAGEGRGVATSVAQSSARFPGSPGDSCYEARRQHRPVSRASNAARRKTANAHRKRHLFSNPLGNPTLRKCRAGGRPAGEPSPPESAAQKSKKYSVARGHVTGKLRPAAVKPGSPESVRPAHSTTADAAQGKAGCTPRGCREVAHEVTRRSRECPRAR